MSVVRTKETRLYEPITTQQSYNLAHTNQKPKTRHSSQQITGGECEMFRNIKVLKQKLSTLFGNVRTYRVHVNTGTFLTFRTAW